jgi:hypothetical protein
MRVITARLVDKPLKGDCMSKVLKLSAITLAAIKTDVDKSIKASRSGVKVIDSLVADGIVHTAMLAPKKGEDRTFYASLEVAVIAGFTAAAQAMLDADVKSLPEVDDSRAKLNRDLKCKGNRRYWQQQVGSKIKDYRNGVEKRNTPEDSDGANDKTTFDSRLKRDLTKYIAQIEKLEASSFSVVDMLKYLKGASALIK